MNDAFDNEFRAVAEKVARTLPAAPTIKSNNGQHGRHEPQPGYDFEELGAKIAEGMMQVAEAQLLEAQNMLEQTRMFAEDVKNRIAGKATELVDLNNRLRTLGATIVTGHQVFCGDEGTNKTDGN
jgi:hypothetical protein